MDLKFLGLLLLLCSLFSGQAFPKNKVKVDSLEKAHPELFKHRKKVIKYDFNVSRYVKKIKRLGKNYYRKKRFPASYRPNRDSLSEQLKNLYDEFDEKVTDRLELYNILKKYDDAFEENWKKHPKALDFHFVVANAALLLPFEGILYKTRPIYEGKNWAKNSTDHNSATISMTLSSIKKYAARLNFFLPTKQWKAGFDFLAAPPHVYARRESKRSGLNADFTVFSRLSGLQAYTWTDILPAVEKCLERQYRILKKMTEEDDTRNFTFDGRFLYTDTKQFAESEDQYYIIDEAAMLSHIGSLNMTIHAIHVYDSYNINRAPKILSKTAKVYGVGGFDFGLYAPGGSSKDFFKGVLGIKSPYKKGGKEFYSKKFPKFLRRFPVGEERMKNALSYLENAVTSYRDAWISLIAIQDPSEYTLFNYNKIYPWKREIELKLKNSIALVFGHSTVPEYIEEGKLSVEDSSTALRSSLVKKSVVKVNLRNFYLNSPKDIKALMPIKFRLGPLGGNKKDGNLSDQVKGLFESDERQWKQVFDKDGDIVKKFTVKIYDRDNSKGEPIYMRRQMSAHYRDFYWGEPVEWNKNYWKPYITNIDAIGVKNAVKTLRQSYGGKGIGSLMFEFLM